MTFDELKKLAEGEGLTYFVAPDRPVLMLGIAGLQGRYQITIPLELDGRFIQFRTIGYQSCPADSPHLNAVLRVLAEINYQLRVTKFGWDPSDGEICGYADLWLENATVTQEQFSGILHAFVPGIDLNYSRITKTIETGTDPGELSPEDVLGSASGLPAKLRGLLERLAAKDKGEGNGESTGPEEI